MAMNATTLKNDLAPDIESHIRTALVLGATSYPKLTAWCNGVAESIATKVIAHIQANAATAAQFSGTYNVTGGGGGTVTITNQPVNGTVS